MPPKKKIALKRKPHVIVDNVTAHLIRTAKPLDVVRVWAKKIQQSTGVSYQQALKQAGKHYTESKKLLGVKYRQVK